jgi:hypothetical protein
MISWNWDEVATERGVVHESVANTDHDDAAIHKQGYRIANPYLSADLQGYWPLQEDSGSTAYDFSGNNNGGSITGASINQTGLVGTSAYSFDGTDDFVGCGDIGLNQDEGFTYSTWIKTTVSDGDQYVISEGNSAFDGPILRVGNGNGRFQLNFTDGTSTSVDGPSSIDDGGWHLLTGVFDSSNDTAYCYVDGDSNSSATSSGSLDVDDFTAIAQESAGADSGYRGQGHFEGTLTDVRIYAATLSSADVQTLYDAVATAGEWVGVGKIV